MGQYELNIFKNVYQNGSEYVKNMIREILKEETMKRKFTNTCKENLIK